MIVNTNLPGSKIIMCDTYTSPRGQLLPVGLMLTIRSIELTLQKKKLRLLAIRNKNIVKKLYDGIPEKCYKLGNASSIFYDLRNDELQDFLEKAKFKESDELYKIITENF